MVINDAWYYFNFFEFIKTFLCPYIWSVFVNVPCALENNVGPFMGRVNSSGWLTVRINFDHCVWVAVQRLPLEAELLSAGSGACWTPTLVVPLEWLVGLSSGVMWTPLLVVLLPGQPGQGSGTHWHQTCVTRLGLPFWGYPAIHCLWLNLLILGGHGRGQSLYKGWLPPA